MLKFFLPDWEDRLDPNYDFVTDNYSKGHKDDPYNYDYYAHQLFKEPPFEGILISLSIFESKIKLDSLNGAYKIRKHYNIKDYLKINCDSNLEIMGDCGAFSYVGKPKPPLPFYSVENIANLYDKLDFDLGVSVDHLVTDYVILKGNPAKKSIKKYLSKREKNSRIKLTIKNAEEFIKLHRINKYDFTPIGVAQGYDLATYKRSVCTLIELGYDNIGIGGLVQYKSDFILDVLKEISPIIKGLNVHLFGILRPNYLSIFEELGVTSFDSASFLRKAWLKSRQNYLALNGKWYSAIRVPQHSNPRLLNKADFNGYSIDDLKSMEESALNELILYDLGKIDVDRVLNTVLEYDSLLLRGTSDVKDFRERYTQTLLDKPWELCNCEICKKLGIQVIIFRGTNRNKRRGFHNVWAFREMLKKCSSP